MDGIKSLAERLHNHHVDDKPKKSPRSVSVTHKTYMLLFAYCRRKKLNIGDVISDLMEMLLLELLNNGELTADDQKKADEYDSVAAKRHASKDNTKTVGGPETPLKEAK